MSAKSIYMNQSYIDYQFDFFTFPVFVALYPLAYVVPTVFVILQTTILYVKDTVSKRTRVGLDPQMFLVITLAHVMNLLFFIADFIGQRLFSTGLLTSWCASHDFGKLLIILMIFYYYICYISMGFPCLVSTLRLVYMLCPLTHKQVNHKVLKVFLSLLFILPVFSLFWLFPARGECRQLYEPYPFGSIFIHYTGEIDNMRHTPFIFGNIILWSGSTIILNILLLLKVIKAPRSILTTRSKKRKMAELSVSLTTAAIVYSGLAAVTFMILYISFPWIAGYLSILRPIGSDLEVVVPPWIFWKTNPAFRKKRVLTGGLIDKKGTVSVINVSGVMGGGK